MTSSTPTPRLPAAVLLVVLLLPLLLFPAAWLGGAVVSADDHLYVHDAWARPDAPPQHNPHLSDPAVQLAPLRQRVVQELAQGRAPLWNPDIFAGAPLLADAQSAPLSPPTLLRLLLPEAIAQDLGVAWVIAWTALGTALLLRRLGAGPWGMAIGAVAAGTGPYIGVWLLHPHAASFAWIPWLLLALEARRGGLLALCVLGLVAGGHPATVVHGLVLAIGWWLLRQRDLRGLLGLLTGALLAAPLWLPVAEQLQRSATFAARRGATLVPAQALDLLWPGWLGHPARETWQGPGAWIDGQLHPGLLVLPLALLALRRPLGRGLWLAWVAALLVAFVGLPLPGNHPRIASEAAWLLAVAAGLGVAVPVARWRAAGPLLLAGVLATGLWARRDDQGTIPVAAHDPAPAAWVLALRDTLGCPEPGSEDGGADCRRVLGLQHALQPNLGARAGLRDLRGYDLPVSRDTERLMAALDPRLQRPWFQVGEPPPAPLLDLASVQALVSPTPLSDAQRAARPDLQAWTQPAPSAVYLRPDPGPRAWLATAALPASSPGQALRAAAGDPAVRSRPPVEGLSGTWPETGEERPVVAVEHGGSEVVAIVQPTARSLLVLADAWAPGWEVEVDGRARPILRVAGVFRGVEVGPGDRDVRFTYRPWGWLLGLRLAALGLLLLLALLAWRPRSA